MVRDNTRMNAFELFALLFLMSCIVLAGGDVQKPGVQRELSAGAETAFAEETVDILDVSEANADAKGFQGGFQDGTYGYLVPYHNGARSGKVARFDLATFSVVQVLDVATADADARGFWGGFQDGTHGYLVPYHNGAPHGKVARFDLATFSVVQVLDVAVADADAKGFSAGFQDGTYGYLVPHFIDNGRYNGKVARFDLATFSVVQVLDVIAADASLTGFDGGFQDGTYGYMVPHKTNHGKVARVDLATFSVVQVLDVAAANADATGFRGGFQDGTYGYLVPQLKTNGQYHGNVARFDLATFSVVQVLDVAVADADATGFSAGFQDGTYGYLVPHLAWGIWHGKVARFDLATFSVAEVLDVAGAAAHAKGFMGGFQDGTYGYLMPVANAYHDNVARFKVAPPTGSTTTSSTTTSSTTFLPQAECTVGYLSCPFPDGESYTVLGSEGLANCSVQHGAALQFISFTTEECNTSTVVEDGKETYHATLVPANRGPIAFVGEAPAIACSCEVVTFADSVGVVIDNLVNPSDKEVTGSSAFEPELRVFASESFNAPLVAGRNPPLMTKFYLEVASSSTDDYIGVLQCLTSPSSDEDDALTQVLVGDACDPGIFGVRRLESPSSDIVRIETLAFKFRDFDSLHIRCTMVRCAIDSTTCGSCGAVRRLSASESEGDVEVASVRIVAPVSNGDGSIMILGEEAGPAAASGSEDGDSHDMMTGHAVAVAIPTRMCFAIGIAMITIGA